MNNIKPIQDFKGYFVSDRGVVYSARNGALKVLKPANKGKYLMVRMNGGGRKNRGSRLVHRLVLEAFVGKRPVGMECRHLNSNPNDNRLENLAWSTHTENEKDKVLNGTSMARAKLNWPKVKLIRVLRRDFCWKIARIANFFDVHESTISYIINNKIWIYV